jgi:transcription antitermination factor NusA-like protein
VLGITVEHAALLEEAVREGIHHQPAIKKHADKHGQRYEVDVPVTGPMGSAIVRTGWIVQEEGGVPQLTSAYVKEKP